MQQGEDVSLTNQHEAPELQLVFSDDQYQFNGVAVSREGRLFVCYPLGHGPERLSLVEVLPGNRLVPFPDATMNRRQPGTQGRLKWESVQALYVDDEDFLWVLDAAGSLSEEGFQGAPKLIKINLQTQQGERTYMLAPGAEKQACLMDVRVDTRKGFAFLSNASDGGLLVVNLNTGSVRSLLQDHLSGFADPNYTFTIAGEAWQQAGRPVKLHTAGLALTPDGEWLYYKPLTDNKLYRIRAKILTSEDMAPVAVSEWVEDLGPFVASKALIFDRQANLYLADLESAALVRVDKDLKMHPLLRDERLTWPGSFAVSTDGCLFVSCAQQPTQTPNRGRNNPCAIYALQLPG